MLRIAYHRLSIKFETQEQLENTYQLLWDIAIRLEDGNLTLAAQQIRDLQRQLMDAMADNKPQDEIDKIIAALRDAINRYRQALIQEGLEDMQRGEMPNQMPGQMGQQGGDPIEELLQALEDMLRAGDMAGAQDIMSQLMDAMENMQFGGLNPNAPGQGNSPMDNALNGLGDMIGRQRGLMDETFRESQSDQNGQGQQNGRGDFRNPDPFGRPGQFLEDLLRQGQRGQNQGQEQGQNQGEGQQNQSPSGEPQDGLSQEQENLRQDLEGLMGELEGQDVERPGALDRALRAMEEAARDLAEGDLDGALDNQNQAIDQMRQGAQEMAQALLDQMQENQVGEQREGQDGQDRDPLGRAQAGNGSQMGDSVKVPEQRDLQRAREILEELRRRASELNRSVEELDYLERLLKRF